MFVRTGSRRLPARVSGLVLAGSLVVACSGAAGESPAEEQTMTVMLADDWASAPAVADAITDFEAEHDVRVMVRPVRFSQLEEFMLADRSGAEDVDVSQWHAFAAGALGYAQPVTDRFAATYDDGTWVPGAIEDVTWAGKIYGVPLDVNAVVMIVNTDLLAELGHTLADLETWEGARAVAEDAAAHGVRLTHLPASAWSMEAWLAANGGQWFSLDADARPTFLFESREVLETFEFLSGLTANHRMAIPAEEVDTSKDAYPLFFEQETLTLATGTWDVARLLGDDPDFAWEVVPMPQGPSADGPGTVLGGSSLYITEQATDPELAWAFATHMVQPEYALRYAKEDGRLPGRTDVLSDPFFEDERYRVAVRQLPYASAMRLISYPSVFELATKSIHAVLNHLSASTPTFRRLQSDALRLVEEADAA